MHALRLLGAASSLVLALQGCSEITGRSLPQMVSDVTLTTQLKSRLALTEGTGTLTRVHVRTYDDSVELSGVVANDAARQRIEREARRLAGDNRVVNNLAVVD